MSTVCVGGGRGTMKPRKIGERICGEGNEEMW